MSIYYSKYQLNTYNTTPYFKAHIPEGYPIERVLIASRAFLRLPPNLQELSRKAKEWATLNWPSLVAYNQGWYDDDGYELNPDTGERLTDEEIDALWREQDNFKVKDIPTPKGGFADPTTWEEPSKAIVEEEDDSDAPSEKSLIKDIESHGIAYTARYYGISQEEAEDLSPKGLAKAILKKRKERSGGAALSTDAQGHQHKGKGEGGGQFTSTGGGDSDSSGNDASQQKAKPKQPKYASFAKDQTREGVPLDSAKNMTRDQAREALSWHENLTMVGRNAPNPKLPDGTRPKDLSDEERGALQKYSYLNDGPLNARLRGYPNPPPETPYNEDYYKEMHSQLEAAFAKTPILNKPVTTVRGMNLPPEVLASFLSEAEGAAKSGQPITFKGYTSTAIAGGFLQKLGLADPTSSIPSAFRGNVSVVMQATHGIDMSPHSQLPGEGELLLPNNSKFKVGKVTRDKTGNARIELTQIPGK